MEQFDGTVNAGRKGVAYDWQSLLVAAETAALDTELRASMRTELDALQRRLRVPMVLITHDPEDVRVFGEQVLRMDGGHMMEDIAHA